jgi:hypothetical protein
MPSALDQPLLVLLTTLPGFWMAAWVGRRVREWQRASDEKSGEDLALIVGGTLTLLGLIIGFTFSMAVGRYDQRKNYEEQEANAIGTEYVRADLLPGAAAAKVRGLLRSYLDQRILYYVTRDARQLRQIDSHSSRIKGEMWSAVSTPALAQPTAVAALAVSGMNDVLNTQGYTQAAWWNRIPLGAWALMIAIAIFSNVLVGYKAQKRSALLFLVLPVALSITLFLIADIDSPRDGVIHVRPQNLVSTAESLGPR